MMWPYMRQSLVGDVPKMSAKLQRFEGGFSGPIPHPVMVVVVGLMLVIEASIGTDPRLVGRREEVLVAIAVHRDGTGSRNVVGIIPAVDLVQRDGFPVPA